MRLLGVELRRLLSRRSVLLLLVLAALVTAVLAVGTAVATRPPSSRELASARAQVEQQRDSGGSRQDLARCRADPRALFGDGATAADCDQLLPTVEEYLDREQLSLDVQRQGEGLSLVVLLVAIAMLAAATYAGADWASGSLSNQLVFDPRRLRVWLAKAGAVLVVTTVVTAVLLVAHWVALDLVARSRGIETSGETLRAVGRLVLRGVALAAAAAVGAYALTMLVRSTIATLGLLFAYLAGGELLLAALPLDRSGRWSPAANLSAWLQGGVRIDDGGGCGALASACTDGVVRSYRLSLLDGGTYLGVLLVLVVVVSALSFRRRDVP